MWEGMNLPSTCCVWELWYQGNQKYFSHLVDFLHFIASCLCGVPLGYRASLSFLTVWGGRLGERLKRCPGSGSCLWCQLDEKLYPLIPKHVFLYSLTGSQDLKLWVCTKNKQAAETCALRLVCMISFYFLLLLMVRVVMAWLWSLNSVPALVKRWTWMHFIQPSEYSLKVDTVGVSCGDFEIWAD